MNLKERLDKELTGKLTYEGLFISADPLQVASIYKDPFISLICALFSYGNAKLIVKFLKTLNFDLLKVSDEKIQEEIIAKNQLYRFETAKDVAQIFITIKRLMDFDIQSIIKQGFMQNGSMADGVNALIKKIYSLNSYTSMGYNFFFSNPFENIPKSPYKRYYMWLRWMVRDSDIDLGLFKDLPKSELILPLDTHTHRVSLAIGLCNRKSYDHKAAYEITNNLKKFDPLDPIKYDFAIYRIGQNKEIAKLKD